MINILTWKEQMWSLRNFFLKRGWWLLLRVMKIKLSWNFPVSLIPSLGTLLQQSEFPLVLEPLKMSIPSIFLLSKSTYGTNNSGCNSLCWNIDWRNQATGKVLTWDILYFINGSFLPPSWYKIMWEVLVRPDSSSACTATVASDAGRFSGFGSLQLNLFLANHSFRS